MRGETSIVDVVAVERHERAPELSCEPVVMEVRRPPEIIVLRGPTPRLRPWLKELAPEFRPHGVLVAIDGAEGGLPAGLDKPAAPGRVNAYVCRGVTCLEPVSEMAALRRLLGGAGIK